MLKYQSLWFLACAFAWFAPTLADNNDATIQPMTDVPQYAQDNSLQLTLMTSGKASPQEYTVTPLTPNLGLNGSQTDTKSIKIVGNLIAADADNYNKIDGKNDIAYLSCDAGKGFMTPDRILHALMQTKATPIKAILLYSISGNWCELSSDTELTYTSIMSMADSGEAGKALSYLKDTDRGEIITARIVGDLDDTGGDSAQNGDGDDGNGNGGHQSIAMSVLYGITGVITVVFLVIIISGAVRAHRNPERYGPRRGGRGGAPRQSRAKGLARAVLEGLPIVKFGDPPAEQKTTQDVEMEADVRLSRERRASEPGDTAGNEASAATETPATTVGVAAAAAAAASTEQTEGQAEAHRPEAAERTMSGAAAVPVTGSEEKATENKAVEGEKPQETPESVECSICTDEFQVGEDVRVLPCNHQFHPACIDPWLIKVSGTCPLCRLDLHPKPSSRRASNATAGESSTSGAGAVQTGRSMSDAGLPPPLELDEDHITDDTSQQPRRKSRLFDLHRLRHATREERLDTLRQIRSAQAEDAAAAAAEGEDQGHRANFSERLRERFRIRTRAQMPRGSEDA